MKSQTVNRIICIFIGCKKPLIKQQVYKFPRGTTFLYKCTRCGYTFYDDFNQENP